MITAKFSIILLLGFHNSNFEIFLNYYRMIEFFFFTFEQNFPVKFVNEYYGNVGQQNIAARLDY